ncbi:MAG: metallophosphoesterase [Xanthobacteraceae bacterium]|nr:metallophosphoesterase [Xanthobacteraceae bacterium]
MSRTFFTADHHLDHVGILRFCNRPWPDVDAMNEALIDGWNAVVRPDDVVYHLGDFAHRIKSSKLKWMFSRLNGTKHLIPGNHDHEDTLALGWKSISPLTEIVVEGQRLVLCHYALRVWNGQRRGAINLFGHSHGRLPGTSLSTDIGVDCWGYTPVTLAEIRQRLVTQPPPESEGDVKPDNNGGMTP